MYTMFYQEFPIFDLKVTFSDTHVSGVDFLPKNINNHHQYLNVDLGLINQHSTHNDISTSFAALIKHQLDNYRINPQFEFNIPLYIYGSIFQQRVWAALRVIDAGHTVNYGQIAKIIGSSPRAVGNACGKNLIPLFIPCHRVIAATGALGGFMQAKNGYNLIIKQWLLKHEQV